DLPEIEVRAKEYNVQVRPTEMPDGWGAMRTFPADGMITLDWLEPGDYEARVRCVPYVGVPGDWVTKLVTIRSAQPDLPVPGSPQAEGVAHGVDFAVTLPAKLAADVEVEYDRAPDIDGQIGAWENLGKKIRGNHGRDKDVTGGWWWYRFRTVDYQGNQSNWAVIAAPVKAKSVEDGADKTSDHT